MRMQGTAIVMTASIDNCQIKEGDISFIFCAIYRLCVHLGTASLKENGGEYMSHPLLNLVFMENT